MITEPDSRAATNALLNELRQGRWRPPAWTRFLVQATRRSVHQARLRPRALGEITALHLGLAALGHRKRLLWTVTSWALAATHLGLLEQRRSLSLADVVTLTRANVPALTTGWAAPVVVLAGDVADGRLARGLGTASPFGAAADSLADAAFWTWFALYHEPSRRVRAAALLAWVVPVVAVTTAGFGRGRMVDAPRPVLLRPAAAMQAVLALRAVRRRMRHHPTGR
ncbi:CDP-alcohol phosphatidyltransferase family protein [Amycolatopsis sp. NPDC051758]|uniref:CDP-alcohol phosphatidyltransferase family protein n=1 Tax=Amycolatopsis sp. NPDC051758 TaxID=3363935 RepID=UPI003797FE73